MRALTTLLSLASVAVLAAPVARAADQPTAANHEGDRHFCSGWDSTFDGRIGGITFHNDSQYPVTVNLWHPDNCAIWNTFTVPGYADSDLGSVTLGSNWGIQLGNSGPIKKITDVSSYSSSHFYTGTNTYWSH